MEKSKLGISLNLFTALLYFLGAIGSWGLLVVAIATGYVLYFEESNKLKRTAVKSLILIVFLVLLTTIITWVTSLFSIVLATLSNYNMYNTYVINNNFSLTYLYQLLQFIPQFIEFIMRIISVLIPIIFGFRAYKKIDIKIKWIDKILDKHF